MFSAMLSRRAEITHCRWHSGNVFLLPNLPKVTEGEKGGQAVKDSESKTQADLFLNQKTPLICKKWMNNIPSGFKGVFQSAARPFIIFDYFAVPVFDQHSSELHCCFQTSDTTEKIIFISVQNSVGQLITLAQTDNLNNY